MQGEQRCSWQMRDLPCPTTEECDMPKVVMCKLMAHHKRDLLIRGANLVKAAREVDVATGPGKGRHFLQPWNFNHHSIRFRSSGLKSCFDASDAFDGPGRILESHRLQHFVMKALTKT